MRLLIIAVAFFLLIVRPSGGGADLIHHFKSPAFNGQGYSAHMLSLEQLTYNRKKDMEDEAQREADRIERELENTVLNKFIRNLESRIYATLSKQLVDNMFGTNCEVTETNTCPTSGTATVEDSQIAWVKSGSGSDEIITLTITDAVGNVTTMSVPLGDFKF